MTDSTAEPVRAHATAPVEASGEVARDAGGPESSAYENPAYENPAYEEPAYEDTGYEATEAAAFAAAPTPGPTPVPASEPLPETAHASASEVDDEPGTPQPFEPGAEVADEPGAEAADEPAEEPAATPYLAAVPAADPAAAAEPERESWFERDVDQPVGGEGFEDDEELPELEGPADPQEWLDQLAAELNRAEQGGFGGGPREALSARIRLAQAYSELGDSVSAAPLAVRNAAQAEELFPSSEGMLAQLREFRDAACEAAGWTAAMMRTAEPEPEYQPDPLPGPRPEPARAEVADLVTEPLPEPAEPVLLIQDAPAEPMLIDELTGLAQAPGVIVIAAPRDEITDAEEVDDVLSAEEATAVDLAAYEEIVRLRYELRDARRTIERLRHVNRKLREALDYEG